MSIFYPKKSLRYSKEYLMIGSLLTTSALSLLGSTLSSAAVAPDSSNMICYGIADNDRGNNQDVLLKMTTMGSVTEIGLTGTKDIEASAFDCEGQTLYAIDGGQLGTIDLGTGAFTPKENPVGSSMNGAEGYVMFNDIDGLVFDCATGKLYGSLRREHMKPPKNDLLIEINPETGKLVSGAFGVNANKNPIDYVTVTQAKQDVDDLAWDPAPAKGERNKTQLPVSPYGWDDEELYIISNDGDGKGSVLGTLEKKQGKPTGVTAQLRGENQTVNDIESLSFASTPNPDGSFSLYGTSGDDGTDGGVHANGIYLIDKLTGISTKKGAWSPKVGQYGHADVEALACHDPTPDCVLYAVHDEGLNDSQIIKIDPFALEEGPWDVRIATIGPLHKKADIEGLVITPPVFPALLGTLYGSSGGDQVPGVKQGHIYKIDRLGQVPYLTDKGATGFYEVSGLGIDLISNVVYGWARGGTKNTPSSPVGPITIAINGTPPLGTLIDPVTVVKPPVISNGRLITPSKEVPLTYKSPDLPSIAMSNDGNTLFAIQTRQPDGTYLWAFDKATKQLRPACLEEVTVTYKGSSIKVEKHIPFIKAEVEGLEMQPNDLLLFAVDYEGKLGFGALQVSDNNSDGRFEHCALVATHVFNKAGYLYDIESIELPEDECKGRSWLYAGSGDREVDPLPEYEMAPISVGAAIAQATNLPVEIDDGAVTIYLGEQRIVVVPTIFDGKGALRSSTRAAEEKGTTTESEVVAEVTSEVVAEVTDEEIVDECNEEDVSGATVDPGYERLSFTNCQGELEEWTLSPKVLDKESVLAALNKLGQGKVYNDGRISVTLSDGSTLEGIVGREVTGPEVPEGGSLEQGNRDDAEILVDEEGKYTIVYPSGHQQNLVMLP